MKITFSLITVVFALILAITAPKHANAEPRPSLFSKIFNKKEKQVAFRRAERKRGVKRRSYRTRLRKTRKRSRRLSLREARRARAVKRARARKARQRRQAAARRAKLFARTNVRYRTREKPGTIIVETRSRHLYHVLGNGRAVRYGVAVGKQGFAWSGRSTIRRKVKWPTWTPPKEMIERKPELAKWANGQPGGPANPLGAAALYLFQGKKDTLYRIHGTNNPKSIGHAASSGCIRMRNEDIQHLYSQVRNGTRVIVR